MPRAQSQRNPRAGCSPHRHRQGPGDGSNDDIRLGRIPSFAEIVEREAQGDRHIRLFAPLTFLSPGIIPAIVDGTVSVDLMVTGLAKALPDSQTQQERDLTKRLGSANPGKNGVQ